MKLCRYGLLGQERPGIIDPRGGLRALPMLDDLTPDELSPDRLEMLRRLDPNLLPQVEGSPRFGVPVFGIGKIVGIGLNYRDHAAETGVEVPTEPVMFLKATSSLSGPNDTIVLPCGSTHTDWEVELGVVIGRPCRYLDEDRALEHVAGYVLANDVSERFDQRQRGTQWSKGKSHDTFCPVGPWLVTSDEMVNPQNVELTLDLNGKRTQTGNTGAMIFDVAALIAYISRFMTLMPGDLILTGTPPGVGDAQSPKRFLRAGDCIRLEGRGLGHAEQRVAYMGC